MLTVHGETKFLNLVFMFLKYVFFVFVLDAIFYGTNFFVFQDTVWLVNQVDVFIIIPFISSTGLAIVAETDLLCDNFLSENIVVTNW